MNTDTRTLVLSMNYQPVGIVHWTRAVTMWFEEKVEIVSEYDHEARSTYLVIKIPAVVRLVSAFRRDNKPVKFSRVNIYARDDYRCQYCGARRPLHELTYDHVIPRARGGETKWHNIATCCTDCNGKKACRTPEEAGMKLLKKPTRPTSVGVAMIRISRDSAPDQWRDYLYWTGELEQE